MTKAINMSMRGITRAILDDLDLHVGDSPKSEHHHDELIEKVLAGIIPPTEPVSVIYSTLRWLQDNGILTFAPDDEANYQPPNEWTKEEKG
jgi:hypothetical protein